MSAKFSKKHFIALLLLVLVAVAAGLRLINLGVPSFWVDELNHVYAGKSLSAGEAPRLPSGNLNQRAWLYSAAVAWSFKIFGVSEFSARFPSALFGVLAIVATFFVAHALFNARVGLLSALLLTFAHMSIGWSRTCRMYTLLQLLYLAAVYAFYRGFDADDDGASGSGKERVGPVSSVLNYFRGQGLKTSWLLVSAGLLYVAYTVHQLAGVFAATVLAYCGAMFLSRWILAGTGPAFTSKHALLLGMALAATTIGVLGFGLIDFVKYAIDFQPAWAKYALVTDTHYYYWLLTESSQFPLAALFIIGMVQMVARFDKPAFYCFCNFVVPVLLQSFVFSYKIPNYVFHVYPFFLILSAYALDNLFKSERDYLLISLEKKGRAISKRLFNVAIWVLIIGWLPMTVWFRYALKLPFTGETGANGAIEHQAWRSASEYVKQHGREDEIIISTLPLTMLYYTHRADYNLNETNIDQTLEWVPEGAVNNTADFYSGAPSIRSVDDWSEVKNSHRSGWVVVDTYRFQRPQYVHPEVVEAILQSTEPVWSDPDQSVRIFHWRDKSEN